MSIESTIKLFSECLGDNYSALIAEKRNVYKNSYVDFSEYEFLGDIDNVLEMPCSNRFEVRVCGKIFKCLFLDGDSSALHVVYGGAKDINIKRTPYSRWSYHKFLPGSFLFIEDPMFSDFEELRLGWYYGNTERSYLQDSIQIIYKICRLKEINEDNIILFSSSGGGYAALYVSTFLTHSLSISINPQIFPQNYLYADEFQKITEIDLKTYDVFLRNDLVKCIEKSTSKHVIIFNAASTHDIECHLKPLASSFEIDVRYGLTFKNNMLLWLYDAPGAPSPHTALETKAIFHGIYFVASQFSLEGRVQDEESRRLQSLALLVNEMWYDLYNEKEKLYRYIKKIDKTYSPCKQFITINDFESERLIHSLYNKTINARSSNYNYFVVFECKDNSNYKVEICVNDLSCDCDKNNYTCYLYDFTNKRVLSSFELSFFKTHYISFKTHNNIPCIKFIVYSGLAGRTFNRSVHIKSIQVFS